MQYKEVWCLNYKNRLINKKVINVYVQKTRAFFRRTHNREIEGFIMWLNGTLFSKKVQLLCNKIKSKANKTNKFGRVMENVTRKPKMISNFTNF